MKGKHQLVCGREIDYSAESRDQRGTHEVATAGCRIEILVTKDMPHLVHHDGEQIHTSEGATSRRRQQVAGFGLPKEFHVVFWRRIDEPAVPGCVEIYQNIRSFGVAKGQTVQIGNSERDSVEQTEVDIIGEIRLNPAVPGLFDDRS